MDEIGPCERDVHCSFASMLKTKATNVRSCAGRDTSALNSLGEFYDMYAVAFCIVLLFAIFFFLDRGSFYN